MLFAQVGGPTLIILDCKLLYTLTMSHNPRVLLCWEPRLGSHLEYTETEPLKLTISRLSRTRANRATTIQQLAETLNQDDNWV
jgi:hypothetical protein